MSNTLPQWVTEAAVLPMAFAQVREDPRIDQYVVERTGAGARVCMVASGGCTAAVLATLGNVEAVHLVDPNPAQLALARLKLRLLEMASPNERLGIVGHLTKLGPWPGTLAHHLAALGLPADALGPPHIVAALGPDFVGRYERCFAALQRELATHREDLDSALALSDLEEQAHRIAPDTPLGRRLDEALDSVMSLPNLVALFGEGATRNPVEPFGGCHFARRIRCAFVTLPAATNPYLWQMLAGCYPENHAADWFTRTAPPRMPEITWQRAFMADALRERPGAFDVVHLSNILDWLSPEEATATLELTARALRPEGLVIIRQLNSTLDIPASGPTFAWNAEGPSDLHTRDRSFFYRALHRGRKR